MFCLYSSERPSRLKGIETPLRPVGVVGQASRGSERPSRLKGIETQKPLQNPLYLRAEFGKPFPFEGN